MGEGGGRLGGGPDSHDIPGPRAVQGEGLALGSRQVGGSSREGRVRVAGLEEGGVGGRQVWGRGPGEAATGRRVAGALG